MGVRRLFLADPGHVLVSCDLEGADARVVAWEAGDEDLMDAFDAGLSVHAKNALDMFGPEVAGPDGRREPVYSQVKRAVHALNYGAKPRTVAVVNGWSVDAAARFAARWFDLHPAIGAWHRRVRELLRQGRPLVSRFGFRMVFWGGEADLKAALAWCPQHTVAVCCDRGAKAIRRRYPWVELLLQVHDELVFQIPTAKIDRLPEIRRAMTVVVPYPRPLRMPWGMKVGPNWEEMVPLDQFLSSTRDGARTG